MALSIESGNRPSPLMQSDLLSESVVRDLIRERRGPFLYGHNGERRLRITQCLIPASKTEPTRIFKLNFKDTRTIVEIINKLSHGH